MLMSRILVTGAAGFIGSQLSHRLCQAGDEVILLDDFSYGNEDNLIFEDYDFRKIIIHKDLCDRQFVENLCKVEKFDYIYHMGAITPLPDCQINPGRAVDVNVTGTVGILEAARKYGVKKVIFSSTSAVYENCKSFPTEEKDVVPPTLVYSSSKFVAEHFCQSYVEAYNMNITVLRFANVYGPHIDCLRKQPPVAGYIIRELYYDRPVQLHSNGEQRRDFVYVDDLIDLAILAKKGEGFDVVNVSTGKTWSINEMYHSIANIMGKNDAEPEYLPTDHYWFRYPALYEGAYPISTKIMDREVLKHTECSNVHAMEKYGWSPKTRFEIGMKNTVDFAIKILGREAKSTH
jgi:UDP-glucose 4-epimerase